MRRYLLTLAFLVVTVPYIDNCQFNRTSAAVSTAPLSPLMPVGQSGDWNLLFSDDFDGTSLDANKRTTCYWWDNDGCSIASNNELEWYQPDDVLVSNGTLKLRAQERTITASDGNTYHYTSGMVTTGRNSSDTSLPARFVFRFGYAEIRAKIPSGKGLWPAFWMLPDDHSSKPEIDAMEIVGHEPDTVHMRLSSPLSSYPQTVQSYRTPTRGRTIERAHQLKEVVPQDL